MLGKPTVLHINAAKNCGSTGIIAEQICLLAQSKGWNSFVAHGSRYNRGGQVRGITVSELPGEHIHYVKSFLFDGHGLGSSRETKKLVRWIELISPDIIHLHNLHGYYINYKILFQYIISKRIPIVWTLHDCWAFTGHCVYFDRVNCEKWKKECRCCPQKAEYPKSLVDLSSRNYRIKKNLFTAVSNMTLVPVSDWLSKLVSCSFLSKYPIKTIHNGIDLTTFKPTNSNFRTGASLEGKFIILGVANGFGRRKGLDIINALSDKLYDDMIIVLVGVKEKEKKHISKRIRCFGRTNNRQDLVNIYSSADVFINPTYEDNFPTTNLEALACGTPVISFRTGGSPEALDERTGFVVDKGDLDGLFSAILTVYTLGKQHYSNYCVNRANDYFNKNDRFEEYIELYNELVSH